MKTEEEEEVEIGFSYDFGRQAGISRRFDTFPGKTYWKSIIQLDFCHRLCPCNSAVIYLISASRFWRETERKSQE